MAQAVIKAVADQLSDRDWFVYAWRDGPGPVLAWGPFSSEKEVETFAGRVALKGEHRAIQIFSPPAVLDRMQKNDEGVQRFCKTCEHPVGTHKHDRMGGRCAIKSCNCRAIGK